jgi:hypothetical protein
MKNLKDRDNSIENITSAEVIIAGLSFVGIVTFVYIFLDDLKELFL